MKTHLPLLLLFGSALHAQVPQADFYGLGRFKSENSDSIIWGLAEYLPPAFTDELLDTSGYTSLSAANGPMTVDPVHKIFYGFIEGSVNPELHAIDIDSREDISVMQFPDYPYLFHSMPSEPMLHYHVYEDRLYSTLEVNPFHSDLYDSTWLIKINPYTSEIDTLLSLPTGNYFGVFNGIDPLRNKIYYLMYNPSSSQDELVKIDLIDLNYETIYVPVFDNYDFFEICFDFCENVFYGYGINIIYGRAFENDIFRFDLQTLDTEVLAEFYGLLDYNLYLDPNYRILYMQGVQTPPGTQEMFTYNILTDEVDYLNYAEISLNSVGLADLAIYTPYISSLDVAINSENYCENAPTNFNAEGNAVEFAWDFGDISSGVNNFSHLPNPEHIFSSSGTFTVQLIASNCFGIDTLTRQVVIQPFEKIDLGNDSVLCSNLINNPIELSVPEIDATIVWQDGTTGNSYIVNSPGIYSVNVMASCGKVVDTIEFNAEICSCEMHLTPNLTDYYSVFYSSCPIENYEPVIDFYNPAGQMVLRIPIISNSQQLNLSILAAGLYFYTVKLPGLSINTGKICIIK